MGWNHTCPHHKTSTLQINEMSTPLKSGHNSSYQAKSDASHIIQSRRTSGGEGDTSCEHRPLYITSSSKERTKGMKMTTP